MGRPRRPTDDHLTYHAINRGNDRRVVLADDEDHLAFLRSLARTQFRYPCRLYGYCLTSNHFHFEVFCRARRVGADWIGRVKSRHRLVRDAAGVGMHLSDVLADAVAGGSTLA